MWFKNKLLVLFLLTVFSGVFNSVLSQSGPPNYLVMEGLVYGYNYEPSKKLLQKEKQIKVEGLLDKVIVTVSENGKVVKTTQTTSNGVFLVKVRTGKIYTLEFYRQGYSPILLTVDLMAVPKEIAERGFSFSGAEIILNSFQSKSKAEVNQPFGKLFYNTKGDYLDFETVKFLTKKQREYINNPVSLMMRSVQKNKGNNSNLKSTDTNPVKSKSEISPESKDAAAEDPQKKNYHDTINKIVAAFNQKRANDPGKLSEAEIQLFEDKIKEARIQFEKNKANAVTAEDSLILKEQEYLLNAIVFELAGAKKVIELQKNQISAQRQLLFLAIACVVLLSVLLLIIYRFNKEKKRTYGLLKEKNKKITDSINYASRIQESILPSDAEIKKQLPQSFIYFQPRDIVSGDFYWLSTIKEKTIVACVDCTGHGVPGAFMSLIGNTLLNEIVNEKEIIKASSVLKHLHLGILKALHQNSDRAQSRDGMEMSLCVIDSKTNTIEYAGAMNPLYVVKDNVVSVIKPDIKAIGGDSIQNAEVEFTDQIITIQKNTSVYMCTDGYMDQFGGPENKKFNIPNFKKLLLDLQSVEMSRQKSIIEQTIQKWRGESRQVDDMLVIGIRF